MYLCAVSVTYVTLPKELSKNHQMLDIKVLKTLDLFAALSLEDIANIVNSSPGRIVTYQPKENIMYQGGTIRALMILTKGSVRAQMEGEEQKRLTIDRLDAPTLLAPAFVYSSQNASPVTMEVTEAAEVLFLDREYFLQIMKEYPSVMRSFMRDISDKSVFLSQKIGILSLQTLRERLLHYLKTHKDIGTHEEIAMLLGVTRPSLSRVLAELIDEGVLHKEGGRYILR